jgi:hypothetical protein
VDLTSATPPDVFAGHTCRSPAFAAQVRGGLAAAVWADTFVVARSTTAMANGRLKSNWCRDIPWASGRSKCVMVYRRL